jgi:hypothetical protein
MKIVKYITPKNDIFLEIFGHPMLGPTEQCRTVHHYMPDKSIFIQLSMPQTKVLNVPDGTIKQTWDNGIIIK